MAGSNWSNRSADFSLRQLSLICCHQYFMWPMRNSVKSLNSWGPGEEKKKRKRRPNYKPTHRHKFTQTHKDTDTHTRVDKARQTPTASYIIRQTYWMDGRSFNNLTPTIFHTYAYIHVWYMEQIPMSWLQQLYFFSLSLLYHPIQSFLVRRKFPHRYMWHIF